MSSPRSKTVYANVLAKSQTVLPQAVRECLRIQPGDGLRDVLDKDGVRLNRGSALEDGDPFASFSEWGSDADDKAYAGL